MSDYSIAIKIAGQLENSFNQAIKNAQGGLSGLGIAGKIGGAAIKATGAAMAAAGTGIAAVGAYSINAGKDFESAMSSVAATADATGKDYKKLEAAAREMGRTTSKTAAESANALEYMALAGWNTNTSIKALPSVLRLSEASGMDLARTSDLVTDSMAALGVNVNQLPSYLDIAAKAQNKSNQSAEQLMEAYLNVGGTMKDLSVPIEESAAALGVMANRGRKGGEAGQALSAIMANLTTGTGQAGKMMKKLGISAFDSEGNFIGLQNTLKVVNNALKGTTDKERNAALAALGGKQHVKDLNKLLDGLNTTNKKGVSEWDQLTKQLNNCDGALEKMAKRKMDNLAGDMTILSSATSDFGISIYKHMQKPLRGLAQYGTEQIGVLSEALKGGGFSGLASAIGNVISDGLVNLTKYAPKFVSMASTLVDSLMSGIENNEDAIGDSLGKLAVSGASAFIRLMPRIVTIGAKLTVSIAKGIIDNLPTLSIAAKEAVSYLMNEAKTAFSEYTNFLGDDSVKPFEKVIAMIPVAAAGFAALGGIGAVAKKIKGFIGILKNFSSGAKGFQKAGSQMSAAAKNIAGIGAGIGLVAASVWLLSDAAIRIADAGPAAQVGLGVMAVGIGALMAIAVGMGSKMRSAGQGLVFFGQSVLMMSAGMSLMALAATQLANAGPLALGGLVIMEGGMITMMTIAQSFGKKLTNAAPGLLAFGGAVLMASAGMSLMAVASAQLAQQGTMAVATLAGMGVGLVAFMGVAALLGPTLTAAAPGLLAFGTSIVLAGTGMLVMSAAALVGATALQAIATVLPQLATSGIAGATAITALGISMTVFAAGAALSGAGTLVAAAGFAALAIAAAAADLAFAPLALEMTAVSTAIAIIAASASTGAEGINSLRESSSGMITSMGKLAIAFTPVAAALVPFAAAVTTAAVTATSLDLAITAIDVSIATLNTMIAVVISEMAIANTSFVMFQAQAIQLNVSSRLAVMAFQMLAAGTMPMVAGLQQIATSMIITASGATELSNGMHSANLNMAAIISTASVVITELANLNNSFKVLAKDASGSVMAIVAVVQTGGSRIVQIAVSTVNGVRNAFNIDLSTSGTNMIQGLINGINSMRPQVETAAKDVANAAANSVNNALQIHSPSRLMDKSGQFVDEGFAGGMLKNAGKVKAAAQAAMTMPVINTSDKMQSNIMHPISDARKGMQASRVREALNHVIEASTVHNNTVNNQSESNPTFVFSPTYQIQGNASKDDLSDIAKFSYEDFKKFIKRFNREQGRERFV